MRGQRPAPLFVQRAIVEGLERDLRLVREISAQVGVGASASVLGLVLEYEAKIQTAKKVLHSLSRVRAEGSGVQHRAVAHAQPRAEEEHRAQAEQCVTCFPVTAPTAGSRVATADAERDENGATGCGSLGQRRRPYLAEHRGDKDGSAGCGSLGQRRPPYLAEHRGDKDGSAGCGSHGQRRPPYLAEHRGDKDGSAGCGSRGQRRPPCVVEQAAGADVCGRLRPWCRGG